MGMSTWLLEKAVQGAEESSVHDRSDHPSVTRMMTTVAEESMLTCRMAGRKEKKRKDQNRTEKQRKRRRRRRKEQKRKDYAFWHQFNEKSSIILGCPGEWQVRLRWSGSMCQT